MSVKVKEAVSNVESIRKALQDFLAPELRGIAIRLEALDRRLEDLKGEVVGGRDELRALREELRGELHAVEARMKEALEQAKREVLLRFELADAQQQISLLAKENLELKQKPPQ